MPFRTAALVGLFATLPALASAQMDITDAYARAASPVAISGAAFMEITNPTDTDDRLIAASSEIAERVELHTHIMEENGVMRMVEVEEGFELPAGETVLLARGGLHVMFLGLRQPLEHGDTVTVTLTFDQAAPVTLDIPVDLERQPDMSTMGGGMMGHGTMGHGAMGGAGMGQGNMGSGN